ncbi:Hydroxysteroid dehydrogenase-like protein 2 [Phlyctochytrium planicorne]|nr:Hydroxysteroid dehydrogenase-like protein 2 [Phlyctochytrium planicorne]
MELRGKTVFISGGSRGIGLAIAKRLAKEGCNIAIAAKTAEPHPKLPGTIYTAVAEIDAAGGRGLPIICDIRSEEAIAKAIAETVKVFGGIDILINNASAISMTDTSETSIKKFDLMNQINGRGTWVCSKLALPYLKESAKKGRNPHILTLSPPLDMEMHWFEPHVAYSMAKYAMSMCTLGLAGELKPHGIAVNALWPKTAIDTAAVTNEIAQGLKMRTVDIMADAALVILSQESKYYTGQFTIDETLLRQIGVTDFKKYRTHPDSSDDEIAPDFFVPETPEKYMKIKPKVVKAVMAKL